ncbi:MAG: type II toxin-antitoxin system RelE/ParE family toxin [Treponema sp.]|nr:type II toxin-antitoxin system RelE/ParE family toxin [Treponema sp.]
MGTVKPITVIETPSFLRDSKELLDDDEREALIAYLAYNPKVGRMVVGTGGIRKMRWARENEGKSGGYRVVYFYHSEETPLFALNVFAKNEKANLTKEERNDLKELTAVLRENYRGKEKKK